MDADALTLRRPGANGEEMMNRSDLASRVAAGTSLSKADAGAPLTAVLSTIAIAASRVPGFKAGETLRDAVNR